MAGKLVKFVVKSALAGSLIYVTLKVTNTPWIVPYDYERSAKNRGNFARSIPNDVKEETSTPSEMFKEKWNNGVKKIFNGIHQAPGALKEFSDKTMTQIKGSYKNSGK